jgi:hypothetical protein
MLLQAEQAKDLPEFDIYEVWLWVVILYVYKYSLRLKELKTLGGEVYKLI